MKRIERRDEFWGITEEYVKLSKDTGKKRFEYSRAHGHCNRYGYDPTPAQALYNDCIACVCEATSCVALGIPIELKTETYGKPDVGKVVEVKLISKNHYGLPIRPDVDDWKPVMGVIIPKGKERENHKLPGWFFAGDAKKPEFLLSPDNGRPPFYSVPKYRLHSLDYLRDLVKYAISSNDDEETIVRKWVELKWKTNLIGVEERLESVT